MSSLEQRNPNLDLLRCLAIVLVLLCHMVLLWPVTAGPFRWGLAGWWGVDLFFVLSGWLIGGLFWREHARFGNVQVPRFMLRRLVRTVPPYLIALMLAWIAVRASRSPIPWDWGFLLFIQNYYERIPFFNPSWSLCVEEHFYLVMPLSLTLFSRPHRPFLQHLLFGTLFFLPVASRLLGAHDADGHVHATHLRMEGLVLGVWAAYMYEFCPALWSALQAVCRWLLVPAIAYCFAHEFLPTTFRHYFGYTFIAISFSCVLVAIVGYRPLGLARYRVTYYLAVWSYSLYLTHTFAINGAKMVIVRTPQLPTAVHVFIMIVMILVLGAAFHYLFEATAIALRDRLIPRRSLRESSSLRQAATVGEAVNA